MIPLPIPSEGDPHSPERSNACDACGIAGAACVIACSAEVIVCRCLQVTESVVMEKVTTLALTTVQEIRRHTGAGTGCTACLRRLSKYLPVRV